VQLGDAQVGVERGIVWRGAVVRPRRGGGQDAEGSQRYERDAVKRLGHESTARPVGDLSLDGHGHVLSHDFPDRSARNVKVERSEN
jgi:hypothetical protein